MKGLIFQTQTQEKMRYWVSTLWASRTPSHYASYPLYISVLKDWDSGGIEVRMHTKGSPYGDSAVCQVETVPSLHAAHKRLEKLGKEFGVKTPGRTTFYNMARTPEWRSYPY